MLSVSDRGEWLRRMWLIMCIRILVILWRFGSGLIGKGYVRRVIILKHITRGLLDVTWNQKQAANRKKVLAKRKENGLCQSCGADAAGKFLCGRCQEMSNERQRQARAKRRASGLCLNCGKNKTENYYCDECVDKKFNRVRICKTDGCQGRAMSKREFCEQCVAHRATKKVYFPKCEYCGYIFTSRSKVSRCCSSECYKEICRREQKDQYRERSGMVLSEFECEYCGKPFKAWLKRQACCSADCGKRHYKRQCRARGRSVHVEDVSMNKLFFRDNGRCRICGRKLNLKRKTPHPLSATIDHIIPLSKGGLHKYINVQLACFRCNCHEKGAGTVAGGEQLLMFGL